MLFETMTLKSAAMLLGSSLALGGATYFLYQRAKKRYGDNSSGAPASSSPSSPSSPPSPSKAAGSHSSSSPSSPSPRPPPARPKKVLVLGLKGAGKSSLIQCLSRGVVDHRPAPTTGFNVVQCRIPAHVTLDETLGEAAGDGWRADASITSSPSSPPPALEMDLWEIGGDDAFRKFWSHFYSDTDCLLFLLDPGAGAGVVGEAAEELARAAGDYRMGAVPIVVVATHQDRRESRVESKELRRLLVDFGISPQILLRIHGVSTPPPPFSVSASYDRDMEDDAAPFGVDDLKTLLAKILS